MPLSKKRMRELSQQRRDVMRQTHDKPVLETHDKPKQEKIAMLRALIANPDALQSTPSPVEEESNTIPRYDPKVHKQGDEVLINGVRVIVPELDGEFNQIW